MTPNFMIVGEAGCGKSHVASFLINKFEYVRYSLATPIKNIELWVRTYDEKHPSKEDYRLLQFIQDWKNKFNQTFDGCLTHAEKDDFVMRLYQELPKIPDVDKKHRDRLQFIGVDLARSINENVWVKNLIKRINIDSKPNPIVVDDVRFKNEFNTLTDLGWISIRLTISKPMQERRLNVLYDMTPEQVHNMRMHSSERDLDNVKTDFTINSDASLMDVYEEVQKIVRSY